MNEQPADDLHAIDIPTTARGTVLLPLLAMLTLAAVLSFPLIILYGDATQAIECVGKSHVDCAVYWMRALGAGGVGVSVLAMILAALTVFPAEAVAMANGKVYGALLGGLLSWSGAMIGANIAFFLARALGPHAIGSLLSANHYARIKTWVNRRGHLPLLTVRLIPLIPYFAINYGAGLLGMRWWTFNWISAIGMLPAAGIFSFMGAMAGEISWLAWGAIVAGIIAAFWLTAHVVGRQ